MTPARSLQYLRAAHAGIRAWGGPACSWALPQPRRVGAEALDHLQADDPLARESRRDLARVHRAMGTQAIVHRAWKALLPAGRVRSPLRILELGAGDGTLLLGVARRLQGAWPAVELTLLDRLPLVSPATLAAYAALGWTARAQVADVRDWAATTADSATPPWDLVSTALFVHHFEGRQLQALLAGIARSTPRFFACEPHRGWLAHAGSHLVGALGANAVTRHDAVASVRAGFRGQEITAQWPRSDGPWQCHEARAGLFSHVFSAHCAGPHA